MSTKRDTYPVPLLAYKTGVETLEVCYFIYIIIYVSDSHTQIRSTVKWVRIYPDSITLFVDLNVTF